MFFDRDDLRDDWIFENVFTDEMSFEHFRFFLLNGIVIEDHRTVLSTDVIALSKQIDDEQEED